VGTLVYENSLDTVINDRYGVSTLIAVLQDSSFSLVTKISNHHTVLESADFEIV